jgi:hypothetical protein
MSGFVARLQATPAPPDTCPARHLPRPTPAPPDTCPARHLPRPTLPHLATNSEAMKLRHAAMASSGIPGIGQNRANPTLAHHRQDLTTGNNESGCASSRSRATAEPAARPSVWPRGSDRRGSYRAWPVSASLCAVLQGVPKQASSRGSVSSGVEQQINRPTMAVDHGCQWRGTDEFIGP